MTYEEYLDEVTTLIFEKYGLTEKQAITMVMRAQDKEFFVRHDDNEKLRNVDQAHADAKALFEAQASAPAAPAAPRKPR